MSAKKFRDLTCVLHVAFYAQRQGLNPLQEQKSVKRRKRGSSIPLTDSPAARDKRRLSKMIDIDHAVICDLGPIEHIKLFRIPSPRELPTIYNHSANTGAASSDELRHGMHHYVGAILDR